MVGGVALLVVLEITSLWGSSSVMWDLSVTVTGLVDRKASATVAGMIVTASSVSEVVLLTVEAPAVTSEPKSSFTVLGNSPPASSWVLEPRGPVEGSVETRTVDTDLWSASDVLLAPPPDAVEVGAEGEMDTSDWSVLGSIARRDGVESEDPTDADVCWCWVALGSWVKFWDPPGQTGLPLSVKVPLNELVKRWLAVSPPSVFVAGALWVYSSVSTDSGRTPPVEAGRRDPGSSEKDDEVLLLEEEVTDRRVLSPARLTVVV